MLYLLNNILLYNIFNCIGGVMVIVLPSSAVDRGLEHRSGQTKDYKIGIGKNKLINNEMMMKATALY
jgi:hypothetical protein